MFFARKIALSKWKKAEEACAINNTIDDFPADTLTVDLKASGNELSIWCVDALDDAVLAMMTNEKAHLETINILYLDDINGLMTKDTKGNTFVKDLQDKHKDIYNLNYKEIGNVAIKFLDAFKNKKVKTYNLQQIKNVLNTAIDTGRVDFNKFNEKSKGILRPIK